MSERSYLDHHAATPLGPSVREAMEEAARVAWANPSSAHAEGRAARAVIERARRAVASALGLEALGLTAADVVLTGGGTEACNLGVLGVLGPGGLGSLAGHLIVTSTTEHPAVERSVAELASRGAQVDALPLHDERGLEALRELLTRVHGDPSRVLVAITAASHETGTTLPVHAIASLLPAGTRALVDASQALGKLPVKEWASPGWAIACSGAKVGACAGAGVLVVPRGVELEPRALGGSQERGRRAGTPDVAAHAGLGAACQTLDERLAAMPGVGALRDHLEAALVALGGVPNGAGGPRLATVTNVSFRGWSSTTLVAALDLEGVAVSAGAACSSGVDAPSPTVRALHPDEPWRASSCVRFSLGPETTEADVERAIVAMRRVLARSPG